MPPPQGSLSPIPMTHGRTRGHSPAGLPGGARVYRLREPRPATRIDPTRTPCPAGPAPRAGSDVRGAWEGEAPPVSAHVQYSAAVPALCPHLAAKSARWRSQACREASWEGQEEREPLRVVQMGKMRPRERKKEAAVSENILLCT